MSPATWPTTTTARRSPPPAAAAWPPSTPNAGWPQGLTEIIGYRKETRIKRIKRIGKAERTGNRIFISLIRVIRLIRVSSSSNREQHHDGPSPTPIPATGDLRRRAGCGRSAHGGEPIEVPAAVGDLQRDVCRLAAGAGVPFGSRVRLSRLEIAPFTLVERVTDIPTSRRNEIRRMAERAGVEVIGLHWLLAKTEGFMWTSPDRAIRRRTVAYLGELARFCADLGGKVLVWGSPKQRDLLPGVTVPQAMDYAAEAPMRARCPHWRRPAPHAGRGAALAANHDLPHHGGRRAELARRVGLPRCRLHLDCIAMCSEPTPIPELIRRHRDILPHFHANDPNQLGPGMGKLDFRPIFAALDEIGYRGWVSVEVFDYRPGGEPRESIAYMKKCLS